MDIITLSYGDVIKVTGARFSRQSVGTVSGYRRECNRFTGIPPVTEEAAIDRAQERGHKLVWLNAEAIVIAANPASVDRSFVAEVNPGQVVEIDSEHAEERGLYRIELPGFCGGDSYKLVRVEEGA